jgi:mannose-6-phosphate isomerase class I
MKQSNYDKFPSISVPNSTNACVAGWDEIASRLANAVANRKRLIVTIDCYPGVNESQISSELAYRLKPANVIRTKDALLSSEQIDQLVAPFLGGNDPVFGFLSGLTLPQFFVPEKVSHLRAELETTSEGIILILGVGARLIADGDVFVYADLPRWEAQLRFRRNQSSNLGVNNHTLAASLQYKRAFFIDWRTADRWKRPLIAKWDFVLDTTNASNPKLAEGEAVRRGLRHAVTRPFRVVPFFDPAPWGGQWMKEVCGLDKSLANYGWCFDCVPEENSILLEFGNARIELPSVDILYQHPRELLGEAVHARFGDEFPIRFDLLDTMGGGNLSFQVHPLTEYIQHHFGMHYTQDESYYLLDAGADATVYLGLKEGIDRNAMISALRKAQRGDAPFPEQRFVNRFPARKHDHFLIPAGTVHCSGTNSLVLEISATPYMFTFKMWDWGRLGLDGKSRPVHLDHGIANIQWERDSKWVESNLINRVNEIATGDGWREERTGLHEREFIDTRRHWFTKQTPHHTHGGVNVLNLVEGKEAMVESLDRAFEPFVVHYAETFIVPAAVGAYTIRPLGNHERSSATLKALVR